MGVILIGYRGSGKTTVGRLLSQRLKLGFLDIDQQIIARSGKSIRDIFQKEGEAAFREMEARAIAEAIKLRNHVIAVGGGALGRDANREAIHRSGHQVVHLHCRPEELLRRIQADPGTADNRPNLTHLGGGIEEIERLLSQREPIYRLVASAELDVTELTPQQAALQIAAMIEK
ncbi:MAG: shikimate kinase [Tepidisphaeraceae bacterium]|jgi:shikimate kinase